MPDLLARRSRLFARVASGFALLAAALAASAPGAAQDAGVAMKPRAALPPSGHVVPPDLEDVEHMCALLTACDRLPLPSGLVPKDFVGCTRALYTELASAAGASFSLTLRECGLRASSCSELRACALRGAKAEACAGRGKQAPVDMCDGDGRAITCVNERISVVRDCPRGGEQCVVRDGKAVCALGNCEKDAPPSCSASGTRIVECKKGKLVSLDCGAFGLRCTTGSDGPKCATAGASCSEGTSRCDGTTNVTCWHGHEVRVDCGAHGLACARTTSAANASSDAGSAPDVVGACAVRAPTTGGCDVSSPPRCDGANIRYCAWGQPRVYLCKSVGLTKCVSDDKTGPRCAP